MQYLKVVKAFVATNRIDPLTRERLDIQVNENYVPANKRHVAICAQSPLDNPDCDVIIIDGHLTVRTFAYWRDKRWLLTKVTKKYDYRSADMFHEVLLDPAPIPRATHIGKIGAKAK